MPGPAGLPVPAVAPLWYFSGFYFKIASYLRQEMKKDREAVKARTLRRAGSLRWILRPRPGLSRS